MKLNKKILDLTDYINNNYNNSTEEVYSCDYSNKHLNGVTLFESSSSGGTKVDISLNDSVFNYSYIKIYFREAGGGRRSCLELIPLNQAFSIQLGILIGTTNSLIYRTAQYSFNSTGTSLSRASNVTSTTTSSGTSFSSTTDDIYILKIVGYK